MNQEEIFILDLRKREEFEKWKIEGVHVTYRNEPYAEIIDNVEKLEGKIAKEQEIVVVCAKGSGSTNVVGKLEKK